MDYNPSKACVAFLNEHRTVETKCFPFYLVCLGNFLIGFKVLSIEKTEDEAKGKLKKAGLPGMVAIIGTGNVIYSFPNEKDLIETK